MEKVIVMTSGKGGTGKTTCTAALSEALALLGKKTLAIDCDVGLKNLDIALGLQDGVLWDFDDVLEGRTAAENAILAHPAIPDLYFLAAPADKLPDEVNFEGFRLLVEGLRDRFDYILLDSPAGIGHGFRLAAAAADTAIVVATGDAASLRDGQKAVTVLQRLGIPEIRLLVNRLDPRALRRVRATVDDIIDSVGAQLIGLVSEDESVPLAANLGTPLMVYGARSAYGQFSRIARRLTGERVLLAAGR